MSARNLYRLMADGRAVASAILVANAGVSEAVLAHWRPFFTVLKAESGTASGLDQAADEMLQNRLLLMLLRPGPAAVVVVATGDGAGGSWNRGIGFVPTLIAARRRGFGVEVLAFPTQIHPRLRALGERAGAFVDLDRCYEQITFLEGLRGALPVLLTRRPATVPRPWQPGELDGLEAPDQHTAA